ncbi:MAG: NAD-dependent epimerase/dehydratase family protein [Candidatus Micrarchaeia archaeon]
MKVVVTGASGVLGRALVPLLAKKHKVLAVTHKRKLAFSGVKVVQADLEQKSSLLSALRGADAVVHLAAVLPYRALSPKQAWKINVEGTRNLVEACEQESVGKLVFASTVQVYGVKSGTLPIDEFSSCSPRGTYSVSKYEAEKLLSKAGFETVVLRVAMVYGPGTPSGGGVSRLLTLANRSPLLFAVDSPSLLNPVYLGDVARAFDFAVSSSRLAGQVCNVAGPDAVSWPQLVKMAGYASGKDLQLITAPKWVFSLAKRVSDPLYSLAGKRPLLSENQLLFLGSNQYFSCKKLAKLGFSPATSLRQGLAETVSSTENKSVQ